MGKGRSANMSLTANRYRLTTQKQRRWWLKCSYGTHGYATLSHDFFCQFSPFPPFLLCPLLLVRWRTFSKEPLFFSFLSSHLCLCSTLRFWLFLLTFALSYVPFPTWQFSLLKCHIMLGYLFIFKNKVLKNWLEALLKIYWVANCWTSLHGKLLQ